MSNDYIYAEDGKIHTRWSELKRCSPGGAEAVVLERIGLKQKYSSGAMSFGTTRHEMWAEESLESKRVPACFEWELKKHNIPLDTPLSHVEAEIKCEIFPGIILHGRPDSVSSEAGIVFDNKTTVGSAKQFAGSDQLLVYAYLLYKLGIPIKHGIFLCEIWSRDHQRILGYDSLKKDFGLTALPAAEKILRDRCETLVVAIDVVKDKLKHMEKPLAA